MEIAEKFTWILKIFHKVYNCRRIPRRQRRLPPVGTALAFRPKRRTAAGSACGGQRKYCVGEGSAQRWPSLFSAADSFSCWRWACICSLLAARKRARDSCTSVSAAWMASSVRRSASSV